MDLLRSAGALSVATDGLGLCAALYSAAPKVYFSGGDSKTPFLEGVPVASLGDEAGGGGLAFECRLLSHLLWRGGVARGSALATLRTRARTLLYSRGAASC